MKPDIAKAARILSDGGVIAFPTDTVYCLAASILHSKAVERIFQIKGRENTKALPVLVSDSIQLRQVAETNPTAELIVRHFMPGALTIILPKKPLVPGLVTGGKASVAVRIPGHTLALYLIKAVGAPLTGTSANISGKGSVSSADDVEIQIGDRIDMILDGGICPGGQESTIIDLTGKIPRIVRDGAVSRAEIEKVIGNVQ